MPGKIPSSQDIKKEIDKVMEELNKEFEIEVDKLQSELEVMTPVDTGHLRDSWEQPKRIREGVYKLSNTASYAYQLLILGRDGNRGSFQLPKGVLPTVRQWKSKLEG